MSARACVSKRMIFFYDFIQFPEFPVIYPRIANTKVKVKEVFFLLKKKDMNMNHLEWQCILSRTLLKTDVKHKNVLSCPYVIKGSCMHVPLLNGERV